MRRALTATALAGALATAPVFGMTAAHAAPPAEPALVLLDGAPLDGAVIQDGTVVTLAGKFTGKTVTFALDGGAPAVDTAAPYTRIVDADTPDGTHTLTATYDPRGKGKTATATATFEVDLVPNAPKITNLTPTEVGANSETGAKLYDLTLTWEPVRDASEYVLWYRRSGQASKWDVVPGDVTTARAVHGVYPDGQWDVGVSAVVNGVETPVTWIGFRREHVGLVSLGAVQNLRAEAHANPAFFNLHWDPVEGADVYYLHRIIDGVPQPWQTWVIRNGETSFGQFGYVVDQSIGYAVTAVRGDLDRPGDVLDFGPQSEWLYPHTTP